MDFSDAFKGQSVLSRHFLGTNLMTLKTFLIAVKEIKWFFCDTGVPQQEIKNTETMQKLFCIIAKYSQHSWA